MLTKFFNNKNCFVSSSKPSKFEWSLQQSIRTLSNQLPFAFVAHKKNTQTPNWSNPSCVWMAYLYGYLWDAIYHK